MSKSTDAAKIWATLERALVGQLMSGSQLDIKRPYLIRLIGDQLEAVNVDPDGVAVEDTSRRGRPQRQRTPSESTVRKYAVDDTIIDAHWSRLLDRACSPRMGYDPDDSVGYEER